MFTIRPYSASSGLYRDPDTQVLTGLEKQSPLLDQNLDPSYIRADLLLTLCRRGDLQIRRGTRRKWVKFHYPSMSQWVPALAPLPPEPSQVRNTTLTTHRTTLAPSSLQSQVHNSATTGVPPSTPQIHRKVPSVPGLAGNPSTALPCPFYWYSFAKHYFRKTKKKKCSALQHHHLPRQMWHCKVVFLAWVGD